MKRIYILFLLAVVSVNITVALSQTKERRVPRPLFPGVEFDINENSSHKLAPKIGKTGAKKLVKSNKTSSAKPKRVKVFTVENDVAGYAPYDTLLLSKVTESSYNSWDDEYTTYTTYTTYTYDEYGHRQLVTCNNGNEQSLIRYTYTIGDFNFWTYKKVQRGYVDEEGVAHFLLLTYVEEREIDTFKRLISQKVYGSDFPFSRERTYDYEHAYFDDTNETEETYGHLVKDLYFNEVGDIISGEEYKWFAPAGNYVLSKTYSDGLVTMDSEIGEDYVKNIHYSCDSNRTYISKYEVSYYGNKEGNLTVSYNGDGTITKYYGNLTETLVDTPKKGDKTVIYYSCISDGYNCTWVPNYRTIYSGCTFNESGEMEVLLGVDYIVRRERFWKNEWCVSWEEKGEWQDGNILAVTDEHNNKYYYKYDSDGNEIGKVEFEDNGNYYVKQNRLDEDFLLKTIYYDANHNELRTLLATNWEINENYDESECFLDVLTRLVIYVKEKNSIIYEPLNVFYEDDDKIEFTYTEEEGYPKTIEYYTKQSDGKYILNAKEQYSYNDNGYSIKHYQYGSGKSYLSSKIEYILLDNGTYHHQHIGYENDGSISYGFRSEVTEDLVHIYYNWDNDTRAFIEYYRWCENIVTTTDDGTEITIYRDLDENGNAVNISKSEYMYKEFEDYYEEMSADYTWDVENEKWVGESKCYTEYKPILFQFKQPKDPCMYDDEYLYSDDNLIEETRMCNTDLYYTWNVETDSWEVSDGYEEDYSVEGDVLTYEKNNYEQDGGMICPYKTQYIITRNEDGYLERLIEYNESPFDEPIFDTETKFTYNEDNLLSEKSITCTLRSLDYYETLLYKYEYENHTVYPTSIEDTYNDADIQINGASITCSENAAITLYDLNGCKVAEGEGSVDAPAAGKYIVRCNGRAFKIVIMQP